MTKDDQTAENCARLQSQLAQIDNVRKVSFYSPDFQSWYKQTGELIESIYGKNSHPCEAFQAVLFTPLFLSCRCGDTVFTEAYEQGMEEVRSLLASCLRKA
ncbi:MAG TPA: hypothetical protein DCG53_11920 [Syntrophus sp. (in: bacteria)]|jgi:hypothetical protein|nr:hypothetical protein [Syntrophus sp. (in: bacteria)]